MQRTANSAVTTSASNLSILTYNVWTGNSSENMNNLCHYLAESDVDIICLQEVTKPFYDKLMFDNAAILQEYEILNPPAADFWDFMGCDGELLMVKKKHQPTFFNPVSLEQTKQNRYFSYGYVEINNVKVGFATAHIESVFYHPAHTTLKAAQLKQVCGTLDDLNVDGYILSGDLNLTGGEQLQAENQCMDSLQLMDVWKQLKKTTDDEADEKFRNEDATWDGLRNPNIADKTEAQRPDRICLRLFRNKVEPVSIERVETSWSDHYGLKANFKVGN